MIAHNCEISLVHERKQKLKVGVHWYISTRFIISGYQNASSL